jgi:uncharacterized protein
VAAYFLDSSAVMKRYVQETGTVWVRALTASGTGNFFYLARIAVAALRQFRRDFGQDYRVVEITIALLQRAAQLADTHALRGYDAVQLAVALDVHARDQALVLVSADAELNAAATAEGLRVEDPNTHP